MKRLCLLLCTLILVLFTAACHQTDSIDLSQDFKTRAYGPNGYGILELERTYQTKNTIDTAAIQDYLNSLNAGVLIEPAVIADEGIGCLIDYKIQETPTGLSNDDVLHIQVTPCSILENQNITLDDIQTGLNIQFQATEFPITITGLTDADNILDISGLAVNYLEYHINGETASVFIQFPEDLNEQIQDDFTATRDTSLYANQVFLNYKGTAIATVTFNAIDARELHSNDEYEITATLNPETALQDIGYEYNQTTSIVCPNLLGY